MTKLFSLRHNSIQINRSPSWTISPTSKHLTDFSEMKANHLHDLSKKHMWLCIGQHKLHVVHQKYFDVHEKKNYPVCVNSCIVTLLDNGHMKCTSKLPNRWGMPSPMMLSTTGESSPLMFHARYHKTYNSDFNSSKHPKIRDAL